MTISRLRSFVPVDPYIAAIVSMVGLATLLPLHGQGAVIGGYATDAAIASSIVLASAIATRVATSPVYLSVTSRSLFGE